MNLDKTGFVVVRGKAYYADDVEKLLKELEECKDELEM